MQATLAREILHIEKISDCFRVASRVSVKGALLIEGDIRPENLRHDAVIGDFNHDVVVHRRTISSWRKDITRKLFKQAFIATDSSFMRQDVDDIPGDVTGLHLGANFT